MIDVQEPPPWFDEEAPPEPEDNVADYEKARRERQQQKAAGSEAAPPPPSHPFIPTAKFMADYVPPSYLIDGIVQKFRLYSLTAKTGHGKTAVGLCCAVAQSLGTPIGKHETTPGRVIYFAAENPDDVKARVILMADRLGFPPDLPLWFVEGAFNITDAIQGISQQAEALGGVDCVYVDTSAAFLNASGFDDENSNTQAFRFAAQLRQLTSIHGNPTVIALTHPTKNPERDNLLPRGGGAFLNETDGNLVLWANDDRSITQLGWAGKFRGASFDPINFALRKGTCEALRDARGRNIPSVWAEPVADDAVERAEEQARTDQDDLLVAMTHKPKGSLTTWAEMLGWSNKQQVHRALHALKEDKLAVVIRKQWHLTKKGKEEAERVEARIKK